MTDYKPNICAPRGARRINVVLLMLVSFVLPASLVESGIVVRAQQRRGGGAQARPERVVPERLGVVAPETLLRIVRAEDERRWETGDLGVLLSDRVAAVRRRAALAAGRIGDEGAVVPLASLLSKDASESVRAMAAFALGETESAAGADALVTAMRTSKSGEVRARAIEALGKIAGALPQREQARRLELGSMILQTLSGEQQQPRPDRGVIMMGLTAALRARPENAGQTVARSLASTDARVRADAANTLARLRATDANEQLRTLLTNDTDAVVRANAARALGASEDAASFDALAARATSDTDERVRVSAIRALASLKDARASASLLERGKLLLAAHRDAKTKGTARPSQVNELLEIATALGRVLANTNDETALAWLREFRDAEEYGAPEVEMAFARIAPAQYLRERPFNKLSGRSAASFGGRGDTPLRWQGVASIAQGLGEVAAVTSERGGNSAISLQADAQIIIRAMLNDPNTPALAMPDVLRAVAASKSPDMTDVMIGKLTAEDVIVRATAAELLGESAPDPVIIRALVDALPKAFEDKQLNDAALAILDALAKQKGSQAFDAIKTALAVPDHLVRRRAIALLRDNQLVGDSQAAQTVATLNKPADYTRALARVGRRVHAQVLTDKGRFTIEFVPDDAPLTVDNFIQLANKKFFDGIVFHRVVPNFVVQGGDPRGDGNGGPGHQIRCEINQVPYARGAVGMALSGKDTGGSQWFVTHSPQPHLDGGYTVFGRVVEGMDVVDRIARGDRIRSIQIVENARPVAPGNRTNTPRANGRTRNGTPRT
jgi:cyclophilin family peptidyl-prolyl cis-trans isomerase/HEAT repeat protein